MPGAGLVQPRLPARPTQHHRRGMLWSGMKCMFGGWTRAAGGRVWHLVRMPVCCACTVFCRLGSVNCKTDRSGNRHSPVDRQSDLSGTSGGIPPINMRRNSGACSAASSAALGLRGTADFSCGKAAAVHLQKRPDRPNSSGKGSKLVSARRARCAAICQFMRVATAASEAGGQGNNCRSPTQSCDQGCAQAHPPPVVWIVEGLPAPKQPKQPSREILDHSRRFIPNTVRPFPSSDSSRAITHLHHSVCPCVPAKLHKLRVHETTAASFCTLPTARQNKALAAPDPPGRRPRYVVSLSCAVSCEACRARSRSPAPSPSTSTPQPLAQHGPPSNLVPSTEHSATKRFLPRAPFPCIPAAPSKGPAPIF